MLKTSTLFSGLFLAASFAVTIPALASPDLASCQSWYPACASNYTASSRPSSYAINYVICHKCQGSAAGGASWFANCSSGASAHYLYDNNSGYCYQSVYEKDIAWHAGNWSTNCNSIGIEHGGYCGAGDNTRTMYNASSLETRSAIVYCSVTWDRTHIRGHNEVPGATHTDPAPDWDWNYYMSACDTRVGGAIRDKYLSLGGYAACGWNTSPGEMTCPDGRGKYNHFQGKDSLGASIYWTSSTNAHHVKGLIRQQWSQIGWETGVCGYPTTDENTCPDGKGKYNHFTGKDSLGASIYYSPATGVAREVHGKIREKWSSMGWERSSLGYPTSNEYSVTISGVVCKRNNFQNGTITWHPNTGTCTVP